MSEDIWLGLLTFAGTVIAAYLASSAGTRKKSEEEAVRDAKRDARVDALEKMIVVQNEQINKKLDKHDKKLDAHNGYAEKFAKAQVDIAEIRKDISHLASLHK